MIDSNFINAQKWFQELRAMLINDIEKIEIQKFIVTEWKHREEGGGKMSKIKGSIIEKGGVNISTVSGKFEKNFSKNIAGTEKDNGIIVLSFYWIRYSTWKGKFLFLEDFVIKEEYHYFTNL